MRTCRQAKADSVPTVAYSDSFGEGGGGGTVPYYLASAFDQIYVHETGLVSFTGGALRLLLASKLSPGFAHWIHFGMACFCLHVWLHSPGMHSALRTLTVYTCYTKRA